MAPTAPNPKIVTIYGRLSFPTFTAEAAYDRSQKGDYPAKDVASAKPDFQLLVEPAQLEKFRNHIVNTFLPHTAELKAEGNDKAGFTAKEIKDLTEQINDPQFDGNFNTPFKPVHEKSADKAPECVATVKCIGNAGEDITLKAIVNDESELLVPDPDLIKFPVVKPIGQTVHSMYAGAYVAVTINLYSYHNGKLPGFSAGATTAVFKADAEGFSGGVAVDEDAIFED